MVFDVLTRASPVFGCLKGCLGGNPPVLKAKSLGYSLGFIPRGGLFTILQLYVYNKSPVLIPRRRSNSKEKTGIKQGKEEVHLES
jgi:hypothetical protein